MPLPQRDRQEVSDLSLVLFLDLLAIERRPLAQVGWLDVLRGTQGGDREDNCHHCCDSPSTRFHCCFLQEPDQMRSTITVSSPLLVTLFPSGAPAQDTTLL